MSIKGSWILALALLIWALLATSTTVYYYNQTVELKKSNYDLENIITVAKDQLGRLTSNVMRIVERGISVEDAELIKLIQILENETIRLNKVFGGTINVNILIDYGNGSRKWYNNTRITMGETLFDVMLKTLNVKYKAYPYGVFVEAINNVYNDPQKQRYWMWWRWDSEGRRWIMGEISCDRYLPVQGEVFAWKYTDIMEWPPKPP
ncbi:MAG: DUF4430 domain-containing protein [Candidatus Methanomethylicia archaeon]